MIKKMMNKKSKRKAFTLIELIIVMAVIAILAAVAVPQYLEIKEKSKVKNDITTAKLLYDSVKEMVTDDRIDTSTIPSGGTVRVIVDTKNPLGSGSNTDGKAAVQNIDLDTVAPQSAIVKEDHLYIAEVNDQGQVVVKIKVGSNERQAFPDEKNKAKNPFSSGYKGKYRK